MKIALSITLPRLFRWLALLACIGFLFALPELAGADDQPLQLTVSVQPSEGGYQLVTLDILGKSRQVVLAEPTDLNFPSWSPDGTRLAFVSGKSGRPQIHRMNADGSERMVRRLTS